MTAHILTIGDEILIGQITDTNSAWMSRELTLRGIRVIGKNSVGDSPEAIVNGILYAAAEADVVIMTGGLGPTKDDITKSTLAEFFDSPMAFHQETYDSIEAYFKKTGRKMPESMVQQATLPQKATVMINTVGSAPGMWFEKDGTVFISLPGVPFEMEYLMTEEVIPRLLQKLPSRPIVHRTLLTAGEGESNIARRLEAFENALPENIKLAYLPSLGQVKLRLSGLWLGPVTAESAGLLEEEVEAQAKSLSAILPDIIFGTESETLEKVIGDLLLAKGLQLATAESCTGGYLAHLITSIPGSSVYYPGSVVAYSYDMKAKLLGVKKETLETYGAVSSECVTEMALGALQTMQVDVAIAVSGIAGPGGGTPDKPVGTVWMAVADKNRTVVQKHLFARDRTKNIQLTGVYALNLARKFLLGEI